MTKPAYPKKIRASIAAFGPMACGKTTIMRAFSYVMSHGPDRRLLEDENRSWLQQVAGTGLRISVRMETAQGEFQEAVKPNPSADHQLDRVYFKRVPVDDKAASYAQKVSSFEHTIEVLDAAGGLLSRAAQLNINSLESLLNTEKQHNGENEQVRQIWSVLNKSCGILVLLDHTSLEGYAERKPAGESEPSVQSVFKPEEYAKMVKSLCWLSRTIPDSVISRRLAVCLSKVDQLSPGYQYREDYRVLIETTFGPQMREALGKLEEHFGEQNVNYFALSSLGYLTSNEVNYDRIKLWLHDPEQWAPHKVHLPFLWLLSEIEKDSIMDGTRGLLSSWRRKSRLSAYIPYHWEGLDKT